VTTLGALVDDIPPVRKPTGRRGTRPGKLDADRSYDGVANRGYLRRRGIESATRLGRQRWRVERVRHEAP
jgi:hypothetical protein